MKCPHCSNDVSIFSSAMNKSAATKQCPHCSGNVRFGINVPAAVVIMIASIAVWAFASNFMSGRIALLIAIVAVTAFSTVLRKS